MFCKSRKLVRINKGLTDWKFLRGIQVRTDDSLGGDPDVVLASQAQVLGLRHDGGGLLTGAGYSNIEKGSFNRPIDPTANRMLGFYPYTLEPRHLLTLKEFWRA